MLPRHESLDCHVNNERLECNRCSKTVVHAHCSAKTFHTILSDGAVSKRISKYTKPGLEDFHDNSGPSLKLFSISEITSSRTLCSCMELVGCRNPYPIIRAHASLLEGWPAPDKRSLMVNLPSPSRKVLKSGAHEGSLFILSSGLWTGFKG